MDAIVKSLQTEHQTADDTKPSVEEAQAAVRVLLKFMGEDPSREGLLDTPKRVVKAYSELFKGYSEDPEDHLDRTFNEVGGYQDIVLVKDIEFFSHCEHHMVPFTGKVHIAYYPDEHVVGLSKLARVVNVFARRLQTQENLTAEITNSIDSILKPRGVAVFVEAKHMCMSMRGVRQHNSSTVTTGFAGLFSEDMTERQRFMDLVLSSKD